jgi:hypothetical protein
MKTTNHFHSLALAVALALNVNARAAGAADNLPPIFNGQDLTGWKVPDWNRYRLEAKGDTFTVWLDGVQVVKYTNAKYASAAPIGLQIHPGLPMKVEFRKLRAKALD